MTGLDLAICPVCNQRVVVTHRYADAAWVGVVVHLNHGEWCPQREALAASVREGR